MHHPTDRIVHTKVFVTPVLEHWLEWEIAQRVHHEGPIWWPIAPRVNALLHQSWSTGRMRNSSMGPPWRIDLMTHSTMNEHFVTPVMELEQEIAQWFHHGRSIWWPTAPWGNTLLHQLWSTGWNKNRIIEICDTQPCCNNHKTLGLR